MEAHLSTQKQANGPWTFSSCALGLQFISHRLQRFPYPTSSIVQVLRPLSMLGIQSQPGPCVPQVSSQGKLICALRGWQESCLARLRALAPTGKCAPELERKHN